jgi:outer membrane immunogenic protein
MSRWLALFLGLAANAALASTALAADLGKGPPPREPIYQEEARFTWSGLYVGVHLGYGWSDIDWQEVPAFSGSHDGDGALLGAQIGYNWQSGRWVYGVEGDVTASWVEGGRGCCDHEINALYSLRGRLGMTGYDNRTLYYVTAGGAWADIDYASAGGYSNTHFGWVIGGGFERAFAPNMSARIEYLYYNFDSDTTPAGALFPGAVTRLDPTLHTVRLGLNYKF